MTVDIDVDISNGILIDKVLQCLKVSTNNRILIAVAGVPGSGKSTVANSVADTLNQAGQLLNDGQKIQSIVVGMDGFHLTRDQLRQMEDPDYAFKRRGAPFTFDAEAFVNFIKTLHDSCKVQNKTIIKAPSFDHKVKDPIVDDVIIPASANVIIIEGLYTLLDQSPWNQVCKLVDQTWFVKVDSKLARDRLAKRHFEAGIESSLEASYRRVDNNDVLNGQLILDNLVPNIDIVIN